MRDHGPEVVDYRPGFSARKLFTEIEHRDKRSVLSQPALVSGFPAADV
jgi:hypothetical protein